MYMARDVGFLVVLNHTSALALSTEQICDLAVPSVVELHVRDTSGEIVACGSGFVVGRNMVATNWHVIKGAHEVTATFHNGRSESVVGLVGSDKSRDIAIVWVHTGNVRPLRLDNSVRIGEDVVAIGLPGRFAGLGYPRNH
jgi:serine protease Do